MTDLAYDAATDRFLLTTQNGIYITDGALGRVVRCTVVDPGFSVDLGRFAGAAFLDSQTVMAVGENKSYVVLRENDEADAGHELPLLPRVVRPVRRGDAVAVRHGSRADDVHDVGRVRPGERSRSTRSRVPNAKVRRLVVSRFDRRRPDALGGVRAGAGAGRWADARRREAVARRVLRHRRGGRRRPDVRDQRRLPARC